MKKIILFFIAGMLMFSSDFSQTTDFNVGAKHNLVVSYLDAYDFTGKTQDDFLTDVFAYGTSLYGGTTDASSKGGIISCWYTINSRIAVDPSFEGVVNLLQQDGIIGTEANAFLKSLITEIPDTSTFQEFTDKLNILDNSFKQQTIYTAKENEVISGIISVYKNSAAHWNDYFGNDNTITPSGRFRLRCFLCVVWQDIKGAAIGYLIGTCICRVIGVPNPAVCGAIGATIFGGLYSWAGKVCPGVCTRCRKPNPNNYPAWICQLPLL